MSHPHILAPNPCPYIYCPFPTHHTILTLYMLLLLLLLLLMLLSHHNLRSSCCCRCPVPSAVVAYNFFRIRVAALWLRSSLHGRYPLPPPTTAYISECPSPTVCFPSSPNLVGRPLGGTTRLLPTAHALRRWHRYIHSPLPNTDAFISYCTSIISSSLLQWLRCSIFSLQ